MKRTSVPGRRNGLKLEFYTGKLTLYYDFIRSSGIQIFIHNSSYTPLTDIEGVGLANGVETDIIIKQVHLIEEFKE